MKVWILQTGEPLHCDSSDYRPMRAVNLANQLISKGHSVTLLSSSFFHQEKRHRSDFFTKISVRENLSIWLIPSPGYNKNISLGRLFDHFVLAFNLGRILDLCFISTTPSLPDIVFIGYPPIESAYVMSSWLRRRGIPSILDVKDDWPLIFVRSFPLPLQPFARILFSPYFLLAKQTIKQVSALSSITEPFLHSSLAFGKREQTLNDSILPLVPGDQLIPDAELLAAEQWWVQNGLNLSNHKRFVFVGSLSRAFDFSFVKESFQRLLAYDPLVELVVCGSGECKADLIRLFSGVNNVYFPGRISFPQIALLMRSSLASIAPYKNTPDFIKSIPNKIIDSIGFGLPVISGLTGEVENLIKSERVGIFCGGNSDSWYQAMHTILTNSSLRNEFAEACTHLYQEYFSSHSVYGSFVTKMERIVDESH